MKYSIIVPVHNVKLYLEQCIKSILNQTHQDFELILIDDGSTDGSGLICDRFAEMYSDKVFVVHKKNQGVLAARLDGVSNARGEFCVFVDSDDFIEEILLEIIDTYLERDSQIDVLLYSFQYSKNGKTVERTKEVYEDGVIWTQQNKKELYERMISSSDINSICFKAIRTNILKEDPTPYIQYYGKNMAEDLLQSLYPMTMARKIMYTTKVLYNYRINDESISRSFSPKTIRSKNTIHVYEKILEYLPVWHMDNEEIHKKLNARWFNETMYMLSKYYEGAVTKADKQAVLTFDWDAFIPDEAQKLDNHYENEVYKKLYYLWKQKKEHSIDRCFWRKKCYQRLKKWKRLFF